MEKSDTADHVCADDKSRRQERNRDNDGKGDREKSKGGIVVVLPLTILLAGTTLRRQVTRSLRRRRLAR